MGNSLARRSNKVQKQSATSQVFDQHHWFLKDISPLVAGCRVGLYWKARMLQRWQEIDAEIYQNAPSSIANRDIINDQYSSHGPSVERTCNITLFEYTLH